MSEIKVSVIITCYNQQGYIKKAIDSVLMQDADFGVEIIISDDCSTDETPRIIKDYREKYPDKITLVLRDKNVGISKNWLDALCMAKGEYVTTLEGDDYWTDPYKLKKQAGFLDKNPDYYGVTHRRDIVDDTGKVYNFFTADMFPKNNVINFDNYSKGVIFAYNSCMHRNFFGTLTDKEYSLVTHNRSIADFTLCMLVLERGPVHRLADVMSVYRIAGDTKKQQSYTSTKGVVDKFYDMKDVLKACEDYGFDKFNTRQAYASWCFMPVLESVLAGRAKDIFKIMKKVPAKSYISIPHMWVYYVARMAKFEVYKRKNR